MIAMTTQPVPTLMARMTAHVLEDTWEMEHTVNVSTCMRTLIVNEPFLIKCGLYLKVLLFEVHCF